MREGKLPQILIWLKKSLFFLGGFAENTGLMATEEETL